MHPGLATGKERGLNMYVSVLDRNVSTVLAIKA